MNNKEIRLLSELIDIKFPVRKSDVEIKADLIRDLFKFDVPVEQIKRVAPFKQIIHTRVIAGIKTSANGKQILVKRVKRTHS
jgi:hypothetical protein